MLQHDHLLFLEVPEPGPGQILLGQTGIIGAVEFFNFITKVFKYPSHDAVFPHVDLQTDHFGILSGMLYPIDRDRSVFQFKTLPDFLEMFRLTSSLSRVAW
jgi:hypothetical protein